MTLERFRNKDPKVGLHNQIVVHKYDDNCPVFLLLLI